MLKDKAVLPSVRRAPGTLSGSRHRPLPLSLTLFPPLLYERPDDPCTALPLSLVPSLPPLSQMSPSSILLTSCVALLPITGASQRPQIAQSVCCCRLTSVRVSLIPAPLPAVVPLDTKASVPALGPSNGTAADACPPFSDPDDLEQQIHESTSRPAPRMVMQVHQDRHFSVIMH